jgi:heme A synthase
MFREIRALFVFALVATLMPIGDAILTASASAPPLTVSRHAATAIVLAVTAYLLFNRAFREGKA